MTTLPIESPQLAILGASSDLSTSSGCIVYKKRTSPTSQYTLGEIIFANQRWGFPITIELDEGFIMPEYLALSHDPINTQERALFFGQPYGDHLDLYIKRYDVSLHRWLKSVKMKYTGTGDVITAYRRSKFAATISDGRIFVYFVNCDGDLVQWVGTLLSAEYSWSQWSVVAKGIFPGSYLGVIRPKGQGYVLFQRASGGLSVASSCSDQWHLTTISYATAVPNGTPLAISDSGRGGLTVYFSDNQTIFALAIPSQTTTTPLYSTLETVGRHAPGTNFEVIYFPRGEIDDPSNNARLVSVSILDGYRTLVERIRRSRMWPEGGDVRWILSGGVIDVDHPFR